jgi:type I restriction enzyme S subunit
VRQQTSAPTGWTWSKVKHTANFFTGWTPPTGTAEFFEGENLWANISDLGPKVLLDTSKRISDEAVRLSSITKSPEGSVLFSFKLSIGQVSFAGTDLYTNEAIATFPPQDGLNTRWAYWAFPVFIPENAGENIYGAKLLNQQLIRSADLLLPPPLEQERIANFLDDKTARIDTLIAEKERLVGLIAEQCLSVAESVVADTSSGQRVKLGFHVDLLPGYAFPSEQFSRDANDIPLLRGVNVTPDGIRWDDVVCWQKDYDPQLERFRLQVGDIVFGMDRPWVSTGARVAMIDADSAGSFLLQRVCRLRGGAKWTQRFLHYVLASDSFRQTVEVDLTGVSVPHISPEQVLGFKVPVLSPSEQEARCKAADRQTKQLRSLEVHTLEMLARLREYRSSLISAAVTGQMAIQ